MGCEERETPKRKTPRYYGYPFSENKIINRTNIYPEQNNLFNNEDNLNVSNISNVKIPKYRNYPKIKLLKGKKPLNNIKTNNFNNSLNHGNNELKNSINLIFPPNQPNNEDYMNYVSFSPPPNRILRTAKVTKLPINNNDISIQDINEGITNYSFNEMSPEYIPNIEQNNFEEYGDNLSGSQISYSPKYPSIPYYEDLANSLNSSSYMNYVNSSPTTEIINLPLTKSLQLNYNDNNDNNIITQRNNSPNNLGSSNNSLNSSLNPDVLKYFNNLELNEFEDFNPELWRKFYPNDESFFNFDKGDVINSQTKSQNKFGDTETYIGEVNQKGEKHGFGRLYSNRYKRIGTWRNNKFMGWGREVRPSGELYEGKFIKDELIGKGIYKNKKILYVGDFYKYIKHGKGDLFSKKCHYKGYFNNNKFYGNGRLDLYQQGVYEGKFRDNQMNGKGIFMWKDGNIYQGEMKDGMISGEGKLIKKNGFIYEGIFVDGPNHGYGTITSPNGKKYEGRFSKGKYYNRTRK